MVNWDAAVKNIASSNKPVTEKVKLYEKLIKEYYAELRDKTAREKSRLGPSNLDEKNLTILRAELKNLQLGKNPTIKEKARIADLKAKISELENA